MVDNSAAMAFHCSSVTMEGALELAGRSAVSVVGRGVSLVARADAIATGCALDLLLSVELL
jgi:hypothetical protein